MSTLSISAEAPSDLLKMKNQGRIIDTRANLDSKAICGAANPALFRVAA